MKTSILALSAVVACAALIASPASAQSTSSNFTYQGRIEQSGVAVNSTADLRFTLFTAATGGSQIGSMVSVSNVNVEDGLFTADIDFGSNAFNGQARWIEIAVRSPAGNGTFVTLSPRQQMTSSPHALFASRPWIVNGNNISYPTGTVSVGNGTLTGSGVPALSAFRDWTGEHGAITLIGDKPTLRFSGGAASNNESWIAHVGTGGQFGIFRRAGVNDWSNVMAMSPNGNVGIGATNPLRCLSVLDQEIVAARIESTNTVGTAIELSNTSNNATWEFGVIGTAPPPWLTEGAMYFARQGTTEPAMTIIANDWVGLGINPAFRLDLPNIASNDGRARANQWVTYSSIRWKNNVHTLDNALDTIKQLRGVSFDWNAEHGGAHDIGFVAEEVGAVVPEIVNWEADGKWAQGVAYDRVTALAVEAIKQQQSQIEDQQSEIDALRKSTDELRQQVAELLQRVPAAMHAEMK